MLFHRVFGIHVLVTCSSLTKVELFIFAFMVMVELGCYQRALLCPNTLEAKISFGSRCLVRNRMCIQRPISKISGRRVCALVCTLPSGFAYPLFYLDCVWKNHCAIHKQIITVCNHSSILVAYMACNHPLIQNALGYCMCNKHVAT